MKKYRIARLLQTSLFLALAVLLTVVPATAEPGRGEKDGFHIVTLEGAPYEMGLQQGKLFKDEIQEVYKIYMEGLVYNDWIKRFAIVKGDNEARKNPKKALAKFAEKIEPHIPREYLDEMRGIADGSGVDYRHILNMAVHVDYFAVMMCSTFAASGPATADGKLIEGRNLDWAKGGLKELDRFSTIAVFKPDKGHPFVSIIYPGIVGALSAVNDDKFTAELNFSMAKENGDVGMPVLIIMRHLIQNSSTLDEAEQLLRGIKRIAGYNITVSDGKTNDARLIEISSDVVGTLGLVNNTLVSTNHFVTKELANNSVNTSMTSEIPSAERFARLRELLKQNYGKINPEVAVTMMHDAGVQVGGTVQTVIFKPADDLMWVWSRNRAPGDFVEFNVAELLGKKSDVSAAAGAGL